MTNPPTLPGLEPAPKLTERQEIALANLRVNGPLNARDLGRYVHAMQGKHGVAAFCSYCESAGLELAKALRAKGLAKRRYRNSSRGEAGWYAVDKRGKAWRAPEPEVDWPF